MHRWETDTTVLWQFGAVYAQSQHTPEKRLLAAMLMDALLEFQKRHDTKGRRAMRAPTDARTWFFARDDRWPFSFENVCLHLHLEPEAIRARLRGIEQARRPRPAAGKAEKS